MGNIAKARELIKGKLLDALVITSRPNYLYFSGFSGSIAALLVTLSKAYLIVDSRYTEQARKEAGPDITVIEYKKSMIDTMVSLSKDEEVGGIGFEGSKVSYSQYEEWRDRFGEILLEDTGADIDLVRMCKDDYEIEKIAKAVEISDKAFLEILPLIKPGVKELDIAAELEYKMKKLGAFNVSFETIIASGERSALPHGLASIKKIELGDAIVMDYGCIYDNFCSDMTRTVFLGEPDSKLKEVYRIVKEAQLAGLENAFSGVDGAAVDKKARCVIEEKGYGDFFGHGLGHGVGLEVHEEPRLSKTGKTVLKDNMVVTVEPGIYIGKLGGVRIEDMIVINGSKPRILTQTTKELIIL